MKARELNTNCDVKAYWLGGNGVPYWVVLYDEGRGRIISTTIFREEFQPLEPQPENYPNEQCNIHQSN